jgi:hypothetical protein
MRLAGWLAGLAVVAGVGGYLIWQDPRVKSLLGPSVSREDPLKFLRDVQVPEPPPRRAEPARPVRKPEPGRNGTGLDDAQQSDPVSGPAALNQVPNPEVARVLIQILKARNLTSGISLSVTDTEIAVFGRVPDEAHLNEIREILEKGREARRVNLSQVQVEPAGLP